MTGSTAIALSQNTPMAWMSFCIWERDGVLNSAMPGNDGIPYDAATIHAKVHNFASGEVRVIRFDEGVRLPPSLNPVDTLIYTVSGRRVWFVDGQAWESTPGDTEFHPVGVRHHVEALEGGIGMEFVFPSASPVLNGKTERIRGAEAPTEILAGTSLRRFAYGPRIINEHRLATGATFADANEQGQLMLVLSGALEILANGARHSVAALDALELPADTSFTISASRDAVWLASPIPQA